jgi:predicted dithiol-disulfide oxidoreductase (DUF899 family)
MTTKPTAILATRGGPKKHKVVSERKWLDARRRLLVKEKRLTRLRDKLSSERRALPWVRVDKDYAFEGPKGRRKLADLFEGRSQLVVYHFMFGPDFKEGCPSCSFWADHFDGAVAHLKQRDTTLAVVSHAPWRKLGVFRKRMGWRFPWFSSHGSDFNPDFGVSFTKRELKAGPISYNYRRVKMPLRLTELPGLSAFYRDGSGAIFHTYSAYGRGIDAINTSYSILDLTAKGRDENPDRPQDWVDFHDRYKST